LPTKNEERRTQNETRIRTRPLLRAILLLGTPAVLENIIGSMMHLVDALMLAQLDNNIVYIAATMLTQVWFWRLAATTGCLQSGFGAYVSRRWGEQKPRAAGLALAHALMFSVTVGLGAAMLLFVLAPYMMRLLTTDPAVSGAATSYFRIMMFAFPLRISIIVVAACLRAAGDTRTPLAIMSFVLLLNVFFNWVLIYGNLGFPRLEMDGAAIGSALAWFIGFALLVVMLFRGVRPRRLIPANARPDAGGLLASAEIRRPVLPPPDALFRLNRPGLRLWMPRITPTVLRVSLPTLGEEILYSAGFITFIGMVGWLGTDVLAAHGAVVRLEAFSFTAGWGIAVATGAMVGQAIGARNLPLARRFFSLNTTVAMVVMGLAAYVFVLFPEQLLGLFRLNDKVMSIGVTLMMILAMQQSLMGASMALGAGLRGAGYTIAPLLTLLGGMLLMRLGLGYWLAWPMGLGIEGIYWATNADWLVRMIVLLWFVRSGKWERVKV
jgi:Na+-driven multidrug efflux pump